MPNNAAGIFLPITDYRLQDVMRFVHPWMGFESLMCHTYATLRGGTWVLAAVDSRVGPGQNFAKFTAKLNLARAGALLCESFARFSLARTRQIAAPAVPCIAHTQRRAVTRPAPRANGAARGAPRPSTGARSASARVAMFSRHSDHVQSPDGPSHGRRRPARAKPCTACTQAHPRSPPLISASDRAQLAVCALLQRLGPRRRYHTTAEFWRCACSAHQQRAQPERVQQ